MLATLLVSAIALTLFIVFCVSRRRLQYWAKKNIPHEEPTPILGNFGEFILQKKFLSFRTQELCKKFSNEPYFGAYLGTEPTLIVQDPAFVKVVLTKDFYFFSGREITKYEKREWLNQNLFSSSGDMWKALRQNLAPMFSAAKMKNMFYLIEKCCFDLENVIDQETKISKVVEVRSLMASFTMDCIGSCAFGIETKSMTEKEDNPFRKTGEAIFYLDSYGSFRQAARVIWPALFYGLGFRTFPKDVEMFFYRMITDIFKGRNHTPTSRNDFIDYVLKMKNKKTITGDSFTNMNSGTKVNIEVTDEILVAQCFIFFGAGYETSATTASFTLYELAKNPEAQQKVLDEVDAYLRRHNNVLKFESGAEMPYLEACLDETLRLYPVLGVLTREVVQDFTFSTGLKVDKGVRVHIPIYHIHHNPDHFPDPEEYRPERFYGEEKKKVKPNTYMPFGDGPRLCIGMRFAKMQMIAGLITVLKKYRLELADDMKRTVEFEPKTIVTQAIGGIRLKLIEREGWEQRQLQKAAS